MGSVLWLKAKDIVNKKDSTGLKSRLLNGAFWSILGAVGGRGLVLLSFIIVARIIGQYAYGELGIIRSTINMFTIFASAGIGFTASKYIAQHRNSDPQKAGEVYVLSTFASLCIGSLFVIFLIFFSPLIAERSLQNPTLADDIQLGALVLFFTTINGVQNGALSGFEDFRIIAINTFLSGVIQSISLIVGCYFWGIEGAIVGLGLGCVALYLLNRRALKKQLHAFQISFKLSTVKKETFGILWKFSFPAILSSIMVIPVLWWAKTYLIQQSGYINMADFDVADQWCTLVFYIPGTLSQIILPLLSNTLEEGTSRQYFKLVKVNLLLNIGISMVVGLGVIVFGKYILGFYGKEFVGTDTLFLMIISAVLISACNVVGHILASQDRMWLCLGFNFVWAVWVVIFTLHFVGAGYGAKGLALAILCSYCLHFLLQGFYVFKFLRK